MRLLFSIIIILLPLASFAEGLVIRVGTQPSNYIEHETLLEKLEISGFSTNLPWFVDRQEYKGFLLSDVVGVVYDGQYSSVTLVAKNNYISNVTYEEIDTFRPLLAYLANNEEITVENSKVSYGLVFNLDLFPNLDRAHYHYKMVFWIKEVVIHPVIDDE